MRCAAIKRGGGQCQREATHDSYCYSHAPELAEKRSATARRGGKAGGNGRGKDSISEVKKWLLSLASDVENGELEAKDGSVVSQILNVYLRGVEVERKIKEQEELEERLEALESVLKGRKSG